MKQKFLIVMLFLSITAIAQVGVQTNDPKATMDIEAQKGKVADGLLVPRLTAEEVQEMTESSSPKKINTNQNSLLVYVTAPFTTTPTTNKEKYDLITSKGFYYYDAYDNSGKGKWKKLYDSNTTLSSGGGGKVYLPGAGITFTGSDKNKVTSSGLERVTEKNDYYSIGTQTNTGWRYVGMDERKYGSTGSWATDLQYIPSTNEEGSMNFYYVNVPGYPGYPSEVEEKTYTQLKNEISGKYTARGTNFEFNKVGAIGNHSVVGGVYNIAEGATGAIFGYGNRSTGLATLVAGRFNDVPGKMSFVTGENNTAEADNSLVIGKDNTLKADISAIIGQGNTLEGSASIVMGSENKINASNSIVLGTNHQQTSNMANGILIGNNCKALSSGIAMGNGSKAIGSNSIAIGESNTATGTGSILIGRRNESSTINTILIGTKLKANKEYQFVCGQNNNFDSGAAFILGWENKNLLVVKATNSTNMGDLHAYGKVFSRGSQISSDIRLKKDIENLPVNSDVLSQLRPVQYHWKEGDNNTLQYGFIAQEIEKIFPNLVDTDTQGEKYKSVNYVGLIPVLTKVLQEKSAEIASQKEEIASLKAQLQAEKERNDAQEARLKAIEEKLK